MGFQNLEHRGPPFMPVKKAVSAKRGTSAKSDDGSNDVDKYLAAVSEPARSTLGTIRATIRSAVPPEATEGISYGIPMFKYKGALVWFAEFFKHCRFFPGRLPVIAAF